MTTNDGDKVSINKKKIYTIITIGIILATCLIGIIYYKIYNNRGYLTEYPGITYHVNYTSQCYTITVISIENEYNALPLKHEWLNISKLGFLLTNDSTRQSTDSAYNNSFNSYNYFSSPITQITNSNENISFKDNDNDKYLSQNDSFIISGEVANTIYSQYSSLYNGSWTSLNYSFYFVILFIDGNNHGLMQENTTLYIISLNYKKYEVKL